MDIEQFKAVQRQVWSEGDYRPVGRLLEPAADLLVQAAGVAAGQRILDVATGAGSVAVLAAQAGADVVGVDLTDAWFGEARRGSTEAGVTVELVTGDAEELPFDDASFDVVLSSFGAIMAPRHEVAAGELVRVCRPGGTIAVTAWIPGGTADVTFSPLSTQLPPPPPFVTPFIRWGDPDHVRALFASHDVTLELQRHDFPVRFASNAAFESFALENSGGFSRARQTLKAMGRWDRVHADFRRAVEASNEAEDGTYRTSWDFLLILARKAPREPRPS
ncbi:class I SAM-dependent methyltransferase [Nitriliruptor alkaliphilus]|uniref:class I SAM-dependent methyltransferase n=1 Tax=Nitriliruptor alkaliphilus TaxID=427918 RepID=UPI0006982412|nr:methyltransferase domain-containing protein [Nitriliruptor alkaliphilus]